MLLLQYTWLQLRDGMLFAVEQELQTRPLCWPLDWNTEATVGVGAQSDTLAVPASEMTLGLKLFIHTFQPSLTTDRAQNDIFKSPEY